MKHSSLFLPKLMQPTDSLAAGALPGERIAHSNLSSKVYQSLRASLATGELMPGQKLTGRMVAERLGVSQTPVREAMLQLVAERALTMNLNRSVTVPILSRTKFIELRDMRVALETLACRCAARHAGSADIDAVEAVHREMIAAKKSGDYARTLRLNREVHIGVYRLARREELLALIESLWVRTGPYLNLIYRNVDPATIEPHEHENLFRALRAGDAEACAASIARDIIEGGRPILDSLEQSAP